MEKTDLDSTFTWEAYSHIKEYELLIIENTMTLRRIYLIILMIMLTSKNINHIKSEFCYLLYGPNFTICDYDFNSMLFSLATGKMINLYDENTTEISESGKIFLFDNTNAKSDFFISKRKEVKEYIESFILRVADNSIE